VAVRGLVLDAALRGTNLMQAQQHCQACQMLALSVRAFMYRAGASTHRGP
jgi:hypothetical protein